MATRLDKLAVRYRPPSTSLRSTSGGVRRVEAIAVLGRAVRTTRGVTGLAIVGFVVLVAVVGPLVAPDSSTTFVTLPFARLSGATLLGGHTLGRDVRSSMDELARAGGRGLHRGSGPG